MDLEVLAGTPDAFKSALDLLGAARFAAPPAPNEWSPAQILIHLRAADLVIAPRFMQVLVRPGVTLPDFDERAVGDRLTRVPVPFDELIGAFNARRSELIALLRTLTAEDLELHGEHETRGRVTITDIYQSLVEHEREHLDQLSAAVARLADQMS